MTVINLRPFERESVDDIDLIAALWNSACGSEFPVSTRFVHFNTRPVPAGYQEGRIAFVDEAPVGFVLVSALHKSPEAFAPGRVWIDAIAVAPPFQRRGIGSVLLSWAEEWLNEFNPVKILVGGSLRPFAPGLPPDLGGDPFFASWGYRKSDSQVWDLARSLSDYQSPVDYPVDGAIRPAQPRDREALLAFLRREFPGRWHWEAERFLEEGGRISDFMLLWTGEGVQGACRLTFEDSVWPIERFYPYRLPRPWGQLGSIGIAAERRGQGLGLALLDGGLRRLHDAGINGCVIDWTDLLEFYARCGFEPYHQWYPRYKAIEEIE